MITILRFSTKIKFLEKSRKIMDISLLAGSPPHRPASTPGAHETSRMGQRVDPVRVFVAG